MANDVKIRIVAQNLFNRGAKAVEAGLGRLRKAARRVGQAMVGMAKRAVIGLAAFSAWSVKTASDVAEMQNKFRVVFGDLTDEVTKWADTHAEKVGRSKFTLQEYLASIQDLVYPMTQNRKEAAEFSKQIVKLGLDIASFQNKNPADVIAALGKSILGERESLKTYGIAIKEADVQQKAFAMGLTRSKKNISEQAKALATLQLIQEKSTDAAGDAERTSGSFANQMRTAGEMVKEMRVELGNALMASAPLNQSLAQLNKTIKDLVEQGKIDDWVEGAVTGFKNLHSAVQPVFDAIMMMKMGGGAAIAAAGAWFSEQDIGLDERINRVKDAVAGSISSGELRSTGRLWGQQSMIDTADFMDEMRKQTTEIKRLKAQQ